MATEYRIIVLVDDHADRMARMLDGLAEGLANQRMALRALVQALVSEHPELAEGEAA